MTTTLRQPERESGLSEPSHAFSEGSAMELAPDTPPRSRSRILNVLLAVSIVVAAALMLGRPIAELRRARTSRTGTAPFSHSDSVLALDGTRGALLARDSSTLLLVVNPADEWTRSHARSLLSFGRWSRTQGIALRMLLSAHGADAGSFSGLAGDRSHLAFIDASLVERLGLSELPSTLLLDAKGRVMARWLGKVPKHLDLLNVMSKIER
jgi:hypothetical protein